MQGATVSLTRHRVYPSGALPRGAECNLPVMALPAGQQRLYFFPNGLFVYDSHGVGVVPYSELEVAVATMTCTENEAVPSDASVVGQTWQYVNKSGGPDRRFRDNRQFPLVHYGGLVWGAGLV